MKLRSCDLRHKITIQTPTESRGTDGSVVPSWATHAVAFAKVNETSGKETFDTERRFATKITEFFTRNVPGAIPKMQIVWDSREFDIQSVVDISNGRRQWLKFVTLERDV